MRVGFDIGGTKIEALLLDHCGNGLERVRVPTPDNYADTLRTVVELVAGLQQRHGPVASVGVGMPGTVRRSDGRVKNSNRAFMNGRTFERDLGALLRLPVLCANDADCFAVSEATDGAGAGARVVFGVIIGTGCGGGIAIGGAPFLGLSGSAGEWGHNPLPWPTPQEYPGPQCPCGKRGCIETWVSGPAFARDHEEHTGERLTPPEIAAQAQAGDERALASVGRYTGRLARSLAALINVLDPDVIVLGGGMSNLEALPAALPYEVKRWVFGGELACPIRRAVHGDSSGVRGAARLFGA